MSSGSGRRSHSKSTKAHGGEKSRSRKSPAFTESSSSSKPHDEKNVIDDFDGKVKPDESFACRNDQNADSLQYSHECTSSGAAEYVMGLLYGKWTRNFSLYTCSILSKANGWYERKKPYLMKLRRNFIDACDYAIQKSVHAYPTLKKWVSHFRKLILLFSLFFLECSLRGIDSLVHLGTTSFLMIVCCGILSFAAMVGPYHFLIILVVAGMAIFFAGFTLALIVVAIFASLYLWIYGCFWVTGLIILIGGLAFSLQFERTGLLVNMLYAMYCTKCYLGWWGLLLGSSMAFISNDVLIYFVKKHAGESKDRNHFRPSSSTPGYGHGSFEDPSPAASKDEAFQAAYGTSMDRGQGVPSTSGHRETELTSEEEVERLLNCSDHYTALGLSRYQIIDVTLLKREYKKKAMLVHPDKNMGNDKAVEAFKKLQNAYEVLLDSLKRKTYDEELRREELLDYFQKFQGAYQKKGKHGLFPHGFSRSEANNDDADGDVRQIECKKCSNFHSWKSTKKSKSQARWCLECKDFHSAKDGDGWVEQSGHPFLFGLLQKVERPSAFVAAGSKIYDVTEWYICQGMQCPPNTHRPSFHVNTSVAAKNHNTKMSGAGAQTMPDMEEMMTEEAFFEWLQNAVQSGMFEENGVPSGGSGNNNNNNNNSATKGSSAGNKKKKRGKKQW